MKAKRQDAKLLISNFTHNAKGNPPGQPPWMKTKQGLFPRPLDLIDMPLIIMSIFNSLSRADSHYFPFSFS